MPMSQIKRETGLSHIVSRSIGFWPTAVNGLPCWRETAASGHVGDDLSVVYLTA